MEGAVVAILVLAAASVFGLVRRGRDGRLRAPRPSTRGRRVPGRRVPGQRVPGSRGEMTGEVTGEMAERLAATEIGSELGDRATLVQFSTAFCAPCRATRRVLGEVAGMVDGVAHVEIDAESHLDLVRRLNVVRTPTVLVLDADGRIVRRASGAPRKADVIAALGLAAS